MRWSPLLLLILVFFTNAKSQNRNGEAIPLSQSSIHSREFKTRKDIGNLVHVELHNGLTVLVEEYPLHPLATVVTYVKAGYKQESVKIANASNLLQRFYVNQSEIAEKIGRLGAKLNGKTDYSSTVLQSCGPAENWPRILKLHAEVLRVPKLDRKKIELEVKVIMEKRRREIQLSEVFGRQKILHMLFPDRLMDWGITTVDRSSIFSKTEVLIQNLVDFHTSHYHPANMIVVISGAVRRDRVLKKVLSLFGRLTSDPIQNPSFKPSIRSLPAKKKKFEYQQIRGDLRQPYVELAYRLEPLRSGDYYPLLLLSYILGKGRDSILSQSLLVRDSSILDFDIRLEVREGMGAFFFSLLPSLERLDSAEVEVLTQLEFLRRSGIPLHQLDRAKALFLKDYYMRLQVLTERANVLAHHAAEGEFEDRERLTSILQEITPKQVSEVLDRYFRDSNLCLLEYLPQAGPERTFSAESLLETLRLLVRANLAQRVGPEEVVAESKEKSSFRPLKFVPDYLKYEIKKTAILNGPVVYFQEEHVLPLVHLGIFFPGGRIDESEKNAGITELLIRSMLRNSREKSAKQGIFLERLGLEIQLVNELDFFGFMVTSLSSDIEKVFGTLLEWIRNPILGEEDIEPERESLLSNFQEAEKMGLRGLLNLSKASIFNQHPYGLIRYGTPESIRSLTPELLRNWFALQMKELHPLIVVRGDVQGTSFLKEFISLLSNSRYSRRQPREIKKPKLMTSPIVEQGEEDIMISFGAPPKGNRDEALVSLAQTALVGPNGSLVQQLRNDRVVASEVSMFYLRGINGGAIFTHATAFKGKEKEVREIILRELEKLKSAVIREPEFLALLVQTITNSMIKQQRGEHFVLELTRNILAGNPSDYVRSHLRRIRSANRNDLMRLARRYFLIQFQPEL